jgi:trehalose 6-phosphate synthase
MSDLQTLMLDVAVILGLYVAARVIMRRQVHRVADWMRRSRTGLAAPPPAFRGSALLAPLLDEARSMSRELLTAQEAAGQEARLRALGDTLWTAERLREHVKFKLSGRPLVVVSNREPYRHVRRGRETECIRPASGLVTGLEPLLRACGGTWIAHGDGDRDRETADENGRLKVPPENPQYQLRRVWLTAEEEAGYYAGFANEGLWPLCHIAHTRPMFRAEDWAYYRRVNRKFADAVLEEIQDQEEPCVLVQDYHFALLPRMIKERRPDARVALFWHIPWPSPESFGICPWQKELLDGLLGADLVGFHTQDNCNNFLDTVDRFLESRINRARFAVRRGDHSTLVRPFPISVVFPEPGRRDAAAAVRAARRKVLKDAGLKAEFIAVGVDRLDYTKGILERFKAVERLLEKNPELRGRFVFFQIGAPSRTALAGYRDFIAAVEAEAARVNARFPGPPAIVLLARHHSQSELAPYYLAADVCVVTSLHDGMNLVCKEFVSAREDEGGALILSRFTGAARELRDALLVNPYDADGVADALRSALTMDERERSLRMSRLRRQVRENNIYRWAGSLISELASVRLPAAR